ncbi:MAG: hypothetical protein CL916_07020, partial [Deltaproteobacteria bacterium]|nr:hypothetical protein [Deltaproteobacteria bacterium]
MTESEVKVIRERLEDKDSFEIQDPKSSIVHSYYYDHVGKVFCRLSIDGVTPFVDSVFVYDDFSVLYQEVLCQYDVSFIVDKMQNTMERIGRFYELCTAEVVDEDAIAEIITKPFNYELLIWDREKSTHGYMTPFQGLVLRRPPATASIRILLEKGVNPNKKTGLPTSQRTAFFHACSYAHYNEVQLMLPYVDINLVLEQTSYWNKPTALMTCIDGYFEDSPQKEERLGIFRLLLEHGANINYVHHNGDSAVMKIIDARRVEYFERIPPRISLNVNYHYHGKDWSDNKSTPLSFCTKKWTVHNDLKEIFVHLLELGADINMKDGDGFPPLFYSVWNEMLEVYDQTEVNWTSTNREGKTALAYYASFNKKKTEIPALLLQRGIDIDSIDNNGDTALHIALRNKDS